MTAHPHHVVAYAIKRNRATIWRLGATRNEEDRVAEIDARLVQLEAERAALTNERRIMTNRCCQRARKRIVPSAPGARR